MDALQVFVNAIVIALMAMYVYENERKIREISARHSQAEKELDVLKIEAKSKEDQIKHLEQLLSTKAETEKLTDIENQLNEGTRKQSEIENHLNAGMKKQSEIENQLNEGTKKQSEIENQLNAGTRKQVEVESQQNTGTRKLAEVENQLLESEKKGVTYIRWGKTTCDGSNTETIYSGQVGSGLHMESGSSVNFICLPNNPEDGIPLQLKPEYITPMFGLKPYPVYHDTKIVGVRSFMGQRDVCDCAVCLAKGTISSIMIPGRKTCYKGWTKEYSGILMSGHRSHTAGSEFACLDIDSQSVASGNYDKDVKTFYPVVTSCGSLKCPPYKQGTGVLCVVCSK